MPDAPSLLVVNCEHSTFAPSATATRIDSCGHLGHSGDPRCLPAPLVSHVSLVISSSCWCIHQASPPSICNHLYLDQEGCVATCETALCVESTSISIKVRYEFSQLYSILPLPHQRKFLLSNMPLPSWGKARTNTCSQGGVIASPLRAWGFQISLQVHHTRTIELPYGVQQIIDGRGLSTATGWPGLASACSHRPNSAVSVLQSSMRCSHRVAWLVAILWKRTTNNSRHPAH